MKGSFLKVLILEDDNSMIKLYNHWLKKANIDIEYCSNGEEAMGSYLKDQNHNFDLIIADLHLEGSKSGEQVINFLKGMEVKSEEATPVLFLSAFIDQEIRTKFKKEKNVKFMEKKNIGYSNFIQRVESLIRPSKKSGF